MKAPSNSSPLNPYNKTHFFSWHWRDILSDIIIIIYSILLSTNFLTQEFLFNTLDNLQLLFLYACIMVIMPWYLGYLDAQYAFFYKGFFRKFIRITIIVLIAICVIFLVWLGPNRIDLNGHFTWMEENFLGFMIFLIVLGPMTYLLGNLSGQSDFEKEYKGDNSSSGDTWDAYFAFAMIYFSVLFLVVFANWLGKHEPENEFLSFMFFFLIFIGACFAGAIAGGILYAFRHLLLKLKLLPFLSKLFSALLPLIIVAALITWCQIALYGLGNVVVAANGAYHPGAVLSLLCLTGFIPLRIIQIMSPPLRLSNLVIGLLSLSFFIYSLFQTGG